MKKDIALPIVAIVVLISTLSLLGWMKVSVWQECRVNHSWLYCLHFINGR